MFLLFKVSLGICNIRETKAEWFELPTLFPPRSCLLVIMKHCQYVLQMEVYVFRTETLLISEQFMSKTIEDLVQNWWDVFKWISNMLRRKLLNTRTNTHLYRLTFNLWYLRATRGDRAAVAYNALDHQCSSCIILSAWMTFFSWGSRRSLRKRRGTCMFFKVFQFCSSISL